MELIKESSTGEKKEVCKMNIKRWSDCIEFESQCEPRVRTSYSIEIDPYEYKDLAISLLSNLSKISGLSYRIVVVEDGKIVKWL